MRVILFIFLANFAHNACAQHMVDQYFTGTPTYTTIATAAQQISEPRDLEFKPFTNELWVINRGTSNGGTTVTIYNAGEQGQTTQFRKDSHSDHFMIYPTAIAFGDNNLFANTNEILATYPPPSIYMGPTLWSADTAIYARVFQNDWIGERLRGSHMDMLHQSPFSMGIAHDGGNAYWVFDGYSSDLCKYNFAADHGPGYEDHDDGQVWRYTDVRLTRLPNVPGHMIKDKTSGWLYIVDAGTKKIKRMNTTTGRITGTLTVPPTAQPENLNGYWAVTGATVQTIDSFPGSQPCGIALFNGRLLVSDYSNGNIYVYNITGTTPVRTGTIATGQAGIMGLRVGADGKIWFVNNTQNTVVRINPASGLNNDIDVVAITAPLLSNFDANYYYTGFNQCSGMITPVITLRNTGTNAITTATIQYQVDHNPAHTYAWTGNLLPGAVTSVTLPAITVANGDHKLEVTALNPNGTPDMNPLNNGKMGSFRTINPALSLPFSEGFSATTFPPQGWSYIHHNTYKKMSQLSNVGGFGNNNGCLRMECFFTDYDNSGQFDYLLTPRINMTNAGNNTVLTFSLAYAQKNIFFRERLRVLASTDCGRTWNTLYDKEGTDLATAANTTQLFVPNAGQWRKESIPLTTYAGKPDVIFQFATTSGTGNNMYIDDISIAGPTGISEPDKPRFRVYPNPAVHSITVENINNSRENSVISIYDVTGRLVLKQPLHTTTKTTFIDLSSNPNGLYLVRIQAGDHVYQEKISLAK